MNSAQDRRFRSEDQNPTAGNPLSLSEWLENRFNFKPKAVFR